MKLYTKRGDDGWTDLFGGGRVTKDCSRVTAYGDVDEANAAIGMALSINEDAEIGAALLRLQSDLFIVGGELAAPTPDRAAVTIGDSDVSRLENQIDHASAQVASLRNFILPGGHRGASALHVARAVARRAERSVIALAAKEPVRPVVVIYLNRLSDLLFALARLANHRAGVPDVPWVSGKAGS